MSQDSPVLINISLPERLGLGTTKRFVVRPTHTVGYLKRVVLSELANGATVPDLGDVILIYSGRFLDNAAIVRDVIGPVAASREGDVAATFHLLLRNQAAALTTSASMGATPGTLASVRNRAGVVVDLPSAVGSEVSTSAQRLEPTAEAAVADQRMQPPPATATAIEPAQERQYDLLRETRRLEEMLHQTMRGIVHQTAGSNANVDGAQHQHQPRRKLERLATGPAGAVSDLELTVDGATAVLDAGKYMEIECADGDVALAVAPDVYERIKQMLGGHDCAVDAWMDMTDPVPEALMAAQQSPAPLLVAPTPTAATAPVPPRDMMTTLRELIASVRQRAPIREVFGNYRFFVTVFKVAVFMEIVGLGGTTSLYWLVPIVAIAAYLWQAGHVDRYVAQLTRGRVDLTVDLPHQLPRQPDVNLEGVVRAELHDGAQRSDNDILRIVQNVQANQRGRRFGIGHTLIMFVGSLVPPVYANWVREDRRRREQHISAYKELRQRLQHELANQNTPPVPGAQDAQN